jgi:hypothetical protein
MTTASRCARALAIVLTAGLLLSLAGGGEPLRAASPQEKPAAGRPESIVQVADEVAREVEQLRGWKFKRPVRKERITLAGARQDLRRMLLAEDNPEHRARVQAFLRVAGLIPPDCDLVQTSLTVLEQQVAGYYEPDLRTLRLVERPTPMPEFVERMILAHELTHALDDQYIDLGDLMRPGDGTEDREFVATSIGEGSATSLMLQHMFAAQKSGRFSMADLSQYVVQELERAKTLEQLPRYFSAMFGSYVVGAAFLARGDLASLLAMPDNRVIGENLLLARRFLPRSSEQVLHAEKFWDPTRRDEPIVVDDRAMERWLARPGRRVVHRDTLGEILTAILTEPRDAARDLARLQTPGGWTNPGAMGWGGDRFYLLATGQPSGALRTADGLQGVWLTMWDTGRDRDEFVAAIEKGSTPPRSVTLPIGRQIAVAFIGFDQAERGDLVKRLQAAPLPMTKNFRPWKDGQDSPAGTRPNAVQRKASRPASAHVSG